MDTHAPNISRVRARLAPLVLSWCRDRIGHAPEFHMVELSQWIARHAPSAPDSAGRILRDLKSSGLIGYEVIKRSDSLYQLTFVKGGEQ